MKLIRLAAAGLVLSLLLCLIPCARASESPDESYYKDKTWEEVIQDLMDKYGADLDSIGVGYYNTVTGEEHYLKPDEYLVAASMYKVPLNMVFTDRVVRGERDGDTSISGYPYESALEETIINSNNTIATNMVRWVLGNGNWQEGRRFLAPYCGLDPETVDYKFLENNFFTPRQFINCLRLLYEENERFPRIIETMQRAEPHNYFKLREQRFNIGHKYGFLQTEYHLYMNDCAICYTDDPILLVLFTDNTLKAYDVMTEFCTRMCDYTQYHTAERKAQEAEEEARLKAEEEARRKAEEEAAARQQEETPSPLPTGTIRPLQETPTPEPAVPSDPGQPALSLIPGAILLGLTVLALVALIIAGRKTRRHPFFAILLALILGGGALYLQYAPELLTPREDPVQTASALLNALENGRYETAYSLLEGNSRLGLEIPPETELGQALAKALQDNTTFSLYGDCQVDRTVAHQLVEARYLDLSRLMQDLDGETLSVLTEYAQDRSPSELYGESGGYKPELREQAALQALSRLLEHKEDYMTSTGLQLELRYRQESWRVVMNSNLLRVLSGGLIEGGSAA